MYLYVWNIEVQINLKVTFILYFRHLGRQVRKEVFFKYRVSFKFIIFIIILFLIYSMMHIFVLKINYDMFI